MPILSPDLLPAVITAGSAVLVGGFKFLFGLAKMWMIRRARSAQERKSLSDINPNFALPWILVGGCALAALAGVRPGLFAGAAAKPRPPVQCKCPGDCLGPTCSCDSSCKCEGCGARPPAKPRPRVSSYETIASSRFAGQPSVAAGLFRRYP